MTRDRITQLRISGLRAIEDLTLDLQGLTVLIGDNGTGKSSILEALELMRLAAAPVSFVHDVVSRGHGGLPALVRRGANELRLGVTIEGAGASLTYELGLALESNIALVELDEHRSVLAFDEPEIHLHPGLLTRVVWMLERAAEHAPVLVATHSDRLLDALHEPARSVVLCDLDEPHGVRLRRPNEERLADWLEDFRGIGSIRADGYQAHVFAPPMDEGGDQP